MACHLRQLFTYDPNCTQSCSVNSKPPPTPTPTPTPPPTLNPSVPDTTMSTHEIKPAKKIPSTSDLPLGDSYLVNILKRDSSNVPTEFEVTNGEITYNGSCWVCNACFGYSTSNWATGEAIVRDSYCQSTSIRTYCSDFATLGSGCQEITVTAPREPPPTPAGPIPPDRPDTGNNNPVGGGGDSKDDDSDGDDSSKDKCSCDSQHQCDLAKEHVGHSFPFKCDQFTNTHGMFVVSGPLHDGTHNGKHQNYGHVSSELRSLFTSVQSYVVNNAKYLQLTVTSGYRCPYGNYLVTRENEGEVYSLSNQTSRHVIGKAADIRSYLRGDTRWTEDLKVGIINYISRKYNVNLYPRGLNKPEAKKYRTLPHVHIAPPRGSYSRNAR